VRRDHDALPQFDCGRDRGVPAERPVEPSEVLATIYHSLGLDLETKLPGPQGRPFPLVDFGTQPIRELL